MSEWINAEEYCVSVFDGTHDTPKVAETGYKLVTSKNILSNTLDLNSAYFISEEDFVNINKRSKVKQYDILFSMIGTVGSLYFETSDTIDYAIKNIGVFSSGDKEKAEWLYYYLQSSYAQQYIKRYLNGAVQKFLPLKGLREFPVPQFNKELHNRIKILLNIDKKIQINNQINQELEAMAKTLYDYWFVQFDFPDQNGKPYKSSGGKMVYNPELKREIPEGWGVETLVDNTLSKVIKPGIDHFTQKTYLATSDVVNTSIKDGRLITFENRETRANMQPSVNSVWFAKMKSSNKHLFLPHAMKELIDSTILSTGFMGLQCKEESFEYIASFISDPNFEIFKDTLSHGATQEAVNIDDLRSVPVIIPDDYILREFHRIAKSIFLNLGRNMIEDKTLSSLRDWLLPMLMNGQVKVE